MPHRRWVAAFVLLSAGLLATGCTTGTPPPPMPREGVVMIYRVTPPKAPGGTEAVLIGGYVHDPLVSNRVWWLLAPGEKPLPEVPLNGGPPWPGVTSYLKYVLVDRLSPVDFKGEH